ncbi:MAG: extracellular solute-binding protein [Microcella sp.]|uniref:sugar ABC transporter substrate-binding protein n=1 Tax=Microcella sp. TaxID=1913979 RepID=UPI00271FC1F9|nr:extracellular solute-binding protein [Microcella sp.]MDO8336950.1 extracellular solute-binding protein [Microcella sp.]
MKFSKPGASVALVAVASLALSACSSPGASSSGPVDVSLWTHAAGNPAEIALIEELTTAFNESQSEYAVSIEDLPQASYNDAIVGAAAAGDLPCILDVDGPVMPAWAYAGYLAPLTVDSAVEESLIGGVKGYYDDTLYSVGLYDAATAIVTRESILSEFGIRVPTVDEPWTGEEFDAALATLQSSGEFENALDMGTGWTGEWYPYAFSPFLQSFGGDLIDRDSFETAEGVLNGPEAIAWGEWWQGLFEQGYVSTKESADRERFAEGTVAMQFNGIWAAKTAADTFDDVLFLPTPDFGAGAKIGAASWQWGISSACENPEAAQAWIDFALQKEWLVRFSNETGNIPATAEAAAESDLFQPGSPYLQFVENSATLALIRPATPAYPVIAKVFEKAAADIMNGADVQRALDAAVDEINADLAANNYYE